jgi:ribonuclease P protein component
MYTFKKEERLCNKKLIERLYHNGSSFLCYPFKVSWLIVEQPLPYRYQVLFSVAKKRYKKAVDRNLVKRRIREAYRLNKQQHLYDKLDNTEKNFVLSIGYVGKEIHEYNFIEKKILKALLQLCEQVNK